MVNSTHDVCMCDPRHREGLPVSRDAGDLRDLRLPVPQEASKAGDKAGAAPEVQGSGAEVMSTAPQGLVTLA